MKKNYLIIIALGFFIVFVLAFQALNKPSANQEPPASALLETQTSNEGPVTITVAPRPPAGEGDWEFEITLDTHSVALDEDLVKAAVLVANNKNYEPVAWDGDGPGGHHRKGTLKFGPITPKPGTLKLIIRQIGGLKDRTFVWSIP